MLLKQAVRLRHHALLTARPADDVVRRFTGKADNIAMAFVALFGGLISYALYELMFEGNLSEENATEILERDHEFVGDGSVTINDLANILVALGREWRGYISHREEETFAVQMWRVARVA